MGCRFLGTISCRPTLTPLPLSPVWGALCSYKVFGGLQRRYIGGYWSVGAVDVLCKDPEPSVFLFVFRGLRDSVRSVATMGYYIVYDVYRGV